MNYWIIMKANLQKELLVERAISSLGFEAWTPMEIRSNAISRFHQRREVAVMPMISQIVFMALPPIGIELIKVRHSAGRVLDTLGTPLMLPETEVREFQAIHLEWLERERRDFLRGIVKPAKKKAEYKPMSKDVLRDLARERFGVELGSAMEKAA